MPNPIPIVTKHKTCTTSSAVFNIQRLDSNLNLRKGFMGIVVV